MQNLSRILLITITLFLLSGITTTAFAKNDKNKKDKQETPTITLESEPAAVVPEPATAMLFGLGVLALAGVSRRKK